MNIPSHAARALDALEAAGFESYIVGGCVRDSLLGREPQDWDICTAARPEETKAVFAMERTLDTGLRHGTVTLLTGDGPLEITTFRTEGDYSDGRRPDSVAFVTSLEADLARRDFTVNAMAYSPRRGLVDCFGGQADLAAGLIRCVGDARERFTEDALRILRGLRFAARYAFTLHPDTAEAMVACRGLLKNVSAERIFTELKGILAGQGAGEMLRQYPAVFFAVMPELEPMLGFDQRHDAHQWDVWTHSTYVVDHTPPEPVLRLAALFHDCAKPQCFHYDEALQKGRFFGHPKAGALMADGILERLRCDNAARERICRLIAHHELRTEGSRTAMRRLLSRLGAEELRELLCLCRADAIAHTPAIRERILAQLDRDEAMLNQLLAEEGRLTLAQLAINGRDLMELGLTPGPKLGSVLAQLLELVLEEQLENNREALLAEARQKIKEDNP